MELLPRLRFLLLVTLCLSGCGGGGGRCSVSGTVTLDGVRVESGNILFLPVEGTKGQSAGGAITQGKYHLARDKGPVPGKYRVEIRASRKTGRQVPVGSPAPPGTMADELVEAIPERYNRNSTLLREVDSSNKALDFELTSP